jgi:hypothetical protein
MPRIPENLFAWLVDWNLVAIVCNTMPPRDPNDDDDEDEEDEEDEDRDDEPAVIRTRRIAPMCGFRSTLECAPTRSAIALAA